MGKHGNKGWRPVAPATVTAGAPVAAIAEAGAPAVPTKPERYGRFRHYLPGQRFTIGEFAIDFWPQGTVKGLPEHCWAEAKAKGFEFLGAAR